MLGSYASAWAKGVRDAIRIDRVRIRVIRSLLALWVGVSACANAWGDKSPALPEAAVGRPAPPPPLILIRDSFVEITTMQEGVNRVVGTVSIPGGAIGAIERKNHLFIGLKRGGVMVFDIKDPFHPRKLMILETAHLATELPEDERGDLVIWLESGVTLSYDENATPPFKTSVQKYFPVPMGNASKARSARICFIAGGAALGAGAILLLAGGLIMVQANHNDNSLGGALASIGEAVGGYTLLGVGAGAAASGVILLIVGAADAAQARPSGPVAASRFIVAPYASRDGGGLVGLVSF